MDVLIGGTLFNYLLQWFIWGDYPVVAKVTGAAEHLEDK
jgi:hypothetical protein